MVALKRHHDPLLTDASVLKGQWLWSYRNLLQGQGIVNVPLNGQDVLLRYKSSYPLWF